MHVHKLIREKDRSKAEWLLEWDESVFRLRLPDGRSILEAPSTEAHRLIEIYELYVERKVSFETPEGTLTFEPQQAAVDDVRSFVEAGLRVDGDYRQHLRGQCRTSILLGLAAFIVGAVPFAAYCWWASWAPDPPQGHWLRSLGWLINLGPVLLLGLTLGGPFVAWFGFRQLSRLRRIEMGL